MSVHSSINLQQSTPFPSQYQSVKGCYTTNNKAEKKDKLFCSVTPYSSISKTLSDHISSKSNGEISFYEKDSGFSTAVNSLMHSQNEQASPIQYENSSSHQYAKSYAPSPATHFRESERDDSSESRYSQSSQYQFGQKSQTEQKLQLYHQEAFKFLLTLNTNLQKFKEAENRRRIQKELNLEESQLNKSYISKQFGSREITSSQTLQSSTSAAPSIFLKKSKVLQEKQNTVQTIIASSFCRSQIFNNKKFARLNKLNSTPQ